jgi:CMP-N-acetylneuraminic acid synthetase
MICALLIGRKGSTGFPGKNTHEVLGNPLCAYPMMAARASKHNLRLFVSTDCPKITEVAKQYQAEMIERPAELADNKALGDHAFEHGYKVIKERLAAEGKELKYLVLLFANGATISGDLIDQGISILDKDPDKDSAVTTSVYNMWSPLRARKMDANGCLVPFVPFETFGDPKTLNCDRDSQGNVYFADMSVSVVRPYCMENLKDGLLPQRWMGHKIASIPNEGGCDVDYEWQIPGVEFWLRKNGIVKSSPELKTVSK